MPRIRTIKPQFWTDTKVGQLPLGARLLFIGTWNLADDEGIVVWNSNYLKGQLFPYDERITNTQINKWMEQLVSLNFIQVFVDEGGGAMLMRGGMLCGNKYGFIRAWHEHQRINRPQPTQHTHILEAIKKENSLNIHGTITDDSLLERNKEKEKEYIYSVNEITEIFEHWNKQGIVNHKKITNGIKRRINSALKEYSLEEIKERITNYSAVLHDPEIKWDYRWSLETFLTGTERMDKFQNLEIAKANYRSVGNNGANKNNPASRGLVDRSKYTRPEDI